MTKGKRKSDVIWRIIVSAVGIALIAMAIANISLFIFGAQTDASVSVRRFGGADNGKPADIRYRWSVDYTFADEYGDIHEGHTTKSGSEMSVNTDDTVYYLKTAPYINGLESEVKPSIGLIIYAGLGIFLIVVMNPKLEVKRSRKPAVNKKGETLEQY